MSTGKYRQIFNSSLVATKFFLIIPFGLLHYFTSVLLFLFLLYHIILNRCDSVEDYKAKNNIKFILKVPDFAQTVHTGNASHAPSCISNNFKNFVLQER